MRSTSVVFNTNPRRRKTPSSESEDREAYTDSFQCPALQFLAVSSLAENSKLAYARLLLVRTARAGRNCANIA